MSEILIGYSVALQQALSNLKRLDDEGRLAILKSAAALFGCVFPDLSMHVISTDHPSHWIK
jgi:hypothetical protein